ncbi:Putative nuclease [Frankliniella fusca]|uniref:Nuclease n=1 Tax=Frankliniella fusca TaxID=407009 RepID=A0AAE1LSX1_9NEOP|nr:Putative nuclease [Frankliniella fusca]
MGQMIRLQNENRGEKSTAFLRQLPHSPFPSLSPEELHVRVQPMDEGIIRNVKHYYRTRLVQMLIGLIGVAGVIDDTLIRITAPSQQKQRYFDKSHDCSMNVMIVSSHRRIINDIYIGQRGSVHDTRVFRRSPLAHALFTRPELLGPNQHLIGDGGYTCTSKV